LTNNPFEIPQDLRAALDQQMQQAHNAYDQISDLVTKTIHSWMTAAPANPMLAGFQDIQSRAMDFAKENAEATFALASKISYAKSPQEVLTLQTQFAQVRMQAFATQIQELYMLSGDAIRKSQHG
jgi:hypothetical protein